MSDTKAIHPGIYIKESLWPSGLTVTDGADRMQVGRPALSNLLNGNSSLTLDMAVRLEVLLGKDIANHKNLLQMQSDFEQSEAQQSQQQATTGVRAYVKSPSEIKATHIEDWFKKSVERRGILPALLRHLVQTTGLELSQVDFPAYDESQRAGWDGEVNAGKANPWIPEGISGWEFGTTEDPKKKADGDYTQRLKLPLNERKVMSFVFVTPHRWTGIKKWADEKRKEKNWKDVRAYDASDLEQWLEQSIASQVWLGGQMGVHTPDLQTLEDEWKFWTSDTRLQTDLFAEPVQQCLPLVDNWLQSPPEEPFRIEARSIDEGVAFVYALLEEYDEEALRKGVTVKSQSAVGRLKLRGVRNFIPIIRDTEAEKCVTDIQQKQHTIVIRQSGTSGAKVSFSLKSPSNESLKKSLAEIGISNHDADKLIRESGGSPTILRRRLTQNPAIKLPAWTDSKSVCASLPLFVLVGKWNKSYEADREILRCLHRADSYEDVEENFMRIASIEDSPVWKFSNKRGVVSKIDALFAVKDSITEGQIRNFFVMAEYVLLERDPSLDLPEEDRWKSGILEKVREHSDSIRKSICDTLCLLSVHGDEFFGHHLGVNIQGMIDQLVSRLLKPFEADRWLSHSDNLPEYAEAAPEKFLEIIEADLSDNSSLVESLIQPVSTSIFGGKCYRTGLLWGLEAIAWNPEHLIHVSKILARLSETTLDDNWTNKPINSLKSIYCSWMPQTAASLGERKKALRYLCKHHPNAGWELCMDQLETGTRMGDYSYRPHWRDDAQGIGEPLDNGRERLEFELEAIELALEWPNHSATTFGDIIERLQILGDELRVRVWIKVDEWIKSKPSDTEKADLRERIRRYALTRRGVKNLAKDLREDARSAYDALTPDDLLIKHAWLFKDHWLIESLDELEEEIDYDERERRVKELRIKALQEIWENLNQEGLMTLIADSGASYLTGFLLPSNILDQTQTHKLVADLATSPKSAATPQYESCIKGLLQSAMNAGWGKIIPNSLEALKQGNADDDSLLNSLMRLCPFNSDTWDLIEELSPKTKDAYWSSVAPGWVGEDKENLSRLTQELLKAKRPGAAISVAHLKWESLDSTEIGRLLRDYATVEENSPLKYRAQEYELLSAFELLQTRADLPLEERASLEFLYLGALRLSDYTFPNLGEQISQSPEFFAQMVAVLYKRSDGEPDPEDFFTHQIKDREGMGHAAYALLENINHIPGASTPTKIDKNALLVWLKSARSTCADYDRLVVGDHHIGKLLMHAPEGSDGIWPIESVRDALEEIAAKEIGVGICLGFANSKGCREVVRGMKEDRKNAEKFMKWSKDITYDHPYVSRLLRDISRDYHHAADSSVSRRKSVS